MPKHLPTQTFLRFVLLQPVIEIELIGIFTVWVKRLKVQIIMIFFFIVTLFFE